MSVGGASALSVDGEGATSGEESGLREASGVLAESDVAYVRNGNTIEIGSYPQTIKAADVTVSADVNDNGYYVGSDGAEYACLTTKRYIENGVTFSNGEEVLVGQQYYFKIEPLKWRVLEEKDGKAFLMSESILDAQIFDGSDNIYELSSIRSWLNKTFYSAAFTEEQKLLIDTTLVINDERSTNPDENAAYWNSGLNVNECINTKDKIFLLSQREVTCTRYGFESDPMKEDEARRLGYSDYSLANCLLTLNGNSGFWWLRSPSATDLTKAQTIDDLSNAQNNAYFVGYFYIGVVPAMWITLS